MTSDGPAKPSSRHRRRADALGPVPAVGGSGYEVRTVPDSPYNMLSLTMTERLKTAEGLIRQFSPEELSQFSNWFADYQDRLWEKQIERDSKAGGLDHLIEQANRDIDAGRVREI